MSQETVASREDQIVVFLGRMPAPSSPHASPPRRKAGNRPTRHDERRREPWALSGQSQVQSTGPSRRSQAIGTAISILESHRSQDRATREYHLTRRAADGPAAKDLVVTSTAIQVEGRNFTVFAVQDMS
jgi:hypothetical protein